MPTSTISTSSTATSNGGSYNQFKTFSEELRLQGNAFNNHLDWLIGGYYANEKLQVADNLSYGNDYDRYANCLVAANFAGAAPKRALLDAGICDLLQRAARSALLPLSGKCAGTRRVRCADQPWPPPSGRQLRRPPFNDSGFSNLAIAARRPGAVDERNGGLDDLYNQTATTGRSSPTTSSRSPNSSS